MKLPALLCLLFFAGSYLCETLSGRYCRSKHRFRILDCYKEAGDNIYEGIEKIVKQCERKHLNLREIGPDYEEVCAVLDTEEGLHFQECTEDAMEQQGELKKVAITEVAFYSIVTPQKEYINETLRKRNAWTNTPKTSSVYRILRAAFAEAH